MKEPIFYIELSTATYRNLNGSGLGAQIDRGNVDDKFIGNHYDNITVSSAVRVFRAIMQLEEMRREKASK